MSGIGVIALIIFIFFIIAACTDDSGDQKADYSSGRKTKDSAGEGRDSSKRDAEMDASTEAEAECPRQKEDVEEPAGKAMEPSIPVEINYPSAKAPDMEHSVKYLNEITEGLRSVFPDFDSPDFVYGRERNGALLKSDKAYDIIVRTAASYSIWMRETGNYGGCEITDALRESEIRKLTDSITHHGTASWFRFFLSGMRKPDVIERVDFSSGNISEGSVRRLTVLLSDAFGPVQEGSTPDYWKMLEGMKPLEYLDEIIELSDSLMESADWIDALHEDFASEKEYLASFCTSTWEGRQWLLFYNVFKESVHAFSELRKTYDDMCSDEKRIYKLMRKVYTSSELERMYDLCVVYISEFVDLIEASDHYMMLAKRLGSAIESIFAKEIYRWRKPEGLRGETYVRYRDLIPENPVDIYRRIRILHPRIADFIRYQQNVGDDHFHSHTFKFKVFRECVFKDGTGCEFGNTSSRKVTRSEEDSYKAYPSSSSYSHCSSSSSYIYDDDDNDNDDYNVYDAIFNVSPSVTIGVPPHIMHEVERDAAFHSWSTYEIEREIRRRVEEDEDDFCMLYDALH